MKKHYCSVMIADSLELIRWALSQLINSNPPLHTVATAASCEEAVTCAAIHQPDIILLDLELGGRNVLEVLPDLLRGSECKVLFLADGVDQALIDCGIVMGGSGVVGKQESPSMVLNAIEKVCNGEMWLDRDRTTRVISALREKEQIVDDDTRKISLLTPKERRVIEAVVRHFSVPNKVIAETLFISQATLRNHLTSIYGKLEVENRKSLYMYATNHGLCHSSESQPKGEPWQNRPDALAA